MKKRLAGMFLALMLIIMPFAPRAAAIKSSVSAYVAVSKTPPAARIGRAGHG